MEHDDYPDRYIRDILERTRRIAVVGLSANPARASHQVFLFLQRHGYEVIGVNPGLAGQQMNGAPIYARLSDVPGQIDMVDVFRNSEAAGETVDEALSLPSPPGVIWLQLGVRNDAAASRAEARGVDVVMNRCTKIEIGRLL